MSKSPKKIAAELDTSRERLQASIQSLSSEITSSFNPVAIVRMATSGAGKVIPDVLRLVRDLAARGRG